MVCPSNPVVSIGPLLAVPGVEDALRARRPDVVAVSPIVAGAALKGPADRMLRELGTEPSVVGVARLYASWAGTLVIDEADAARTRRGGGGRGALHRGADGHELAATGRRPRRRWCSMPDGDGLTVLAVPGIGEVLPGADLGRVIADALAPATAQGPDLQDGDVLVVTQKVVSKAEGRLVELDHDGPRSEGRPGRTGIRADAATPR